MANEVVIHIKGDSKDAEKAVEGFTDKLKAASGDLKKVGAAMLGFGAALTAGLTLSVKAAAEEEVGIARLSQALKNVGVSYDAVKKSLEANIMATQQKTAVADEEQRDVLTELVTMTGSYEKALGLMSLTLDVAANKNRSLSEAARIVGLTAVGETGRLKQMGIVIKEGATASEALAEIMKTVQGSAEKMGQSAGKQFELLKNNFGDAAQELGKTLLPALMRITKILSDATLWFQNLSPEMKKFIGISTAVTAGVSILAGSFALFLAMIPSILAGAASVGIAFHAMLGPVGLITAAVSAAVAIGVALALNWDTVRRAVQIGVNAILGAVESFANGSIRGFNAVIRGINSFSSAISFGAIPAIKEIAEIQLPRLEVSAGKAAEGGEKAAKGFAGGFEKAAGDIKANLQEVIDQADKFGSQLIAALKIRNEQMETAEVSRIQKQLDLQDGLNQRIGQALRDGLDLFKETLAKEKDALRDANDAKKEQYETDALNRIGLLNAKTIQDVKYYQNLIKGLQNQTDAEEKAQRDKENLIKREELIKQTHLARLTNDQEKIKKADKDYYDFENQLIRERDKNFRQQKIEVIRETIDSIQTRAAEEEKGIKEQLARDKKAADELLKQELKTKDESIEIETEHVKKLLEKMEEDTQNRKEKLSEQLENVKAHYKILNSEEALQAEARKLAVDNNNAEIIEILNTYNPKWQDAGQTFGQRLIEGLNSEKANVEKAVADMLALVGRAQGVTIAGGKLGNNQIDIIAKASWERSAEAARDVGITAFESGGVALKPTLGIIGEKEPEIVMPLSKLEKAVADMLALVGRTQGLTIAGGTLPASLSGSHIDKIAQASWAQSAMATRGMGITEFATGGIALKPTLGIVGDKEPEAVIPLSKFGDVNPGNISVTIINHGAIGITDLDRHIMQTIRDGKRRGAFQGVIA